MFVPAQENDELDVNNNTQDSGPSHSPLDDELPVTPMMVGQTQAFWLRHYDVRRARTLASAVNVLHEEFKRELELADARMRSDMERELQEKTDTYSSHYSNQIDQHVKQLEDKYAAELEEIKKKQWCFQCGEEAQLFCCYSVAYCGKSCQQVHWPVHRGYCRRPKPKVVNSPEEALEKEEQQLL